MINFAHIHLMMNHIPVIGLPIVLALFCFALVKRQAFMIRVSLLALVGIAVFVLPVYFTGGYAEEVVEFLPGFAESFIESHEEAALFSMILTLATGVLAAVSFWFQTDRSKGKIANFAVIGVGCLAVVSLVYTANLGGKIRHTEFRSDGPSEQSAPMSSQKDD